VVKTAAEDDSVIFARYRKCTESSSAAVCTRRDVIDDCSNCLSVRCLRDVEKRDQTSRRRIFQ
jgi:hypothetical protein